MLKTQQKKYKELERINDWIDIINTQAEDNNIKIINNIDYLTETRTRAAPNNNENSDYSRSRSTKRQNRQRQLTPNTRRRRSTTPATTPPDFLRLTQKTRTRNDNQYYAWYIFSCRKWSTYVHHGTFRGTPQDPSTKDTETRIKRPAHQDHINIKNGHQINFYRIGAQIQDKHLIMSHTFYLYSRRKRRARRRHGVRSSTKMTRS